MTNAGEIANADLLPVQTEQNDRTEANDEADQHDVVGDRMRHLNVAKVFESEIEHEQSERPDHTDDADHIQRDEKAFGNHNQLLDDDGVIGRRLAADPLFVIHPGQIVRLSVVIAEQVVLSFGHLLHLCQRNTITCSS